jgi:TolA-binding protein
MTHPDDMDDLFAAARGGLQPPPGAQERVLAKVAAVGVGGGSTGSGGHLASVRGAGVKLTLLTVVAAGAVGAGLLAQREISVDASLQRVGTLLSAPATHAPQPPPAVTIDLDADAAAEKLASATPQTPASGATAAVQSKKPATDTLAEEIALLRRAQAALRSGNASGALSLLDEHATRFPKGTLAHERLVTRVQALCKAGRIAQARGLYRAIAGGNPRSPHLAALRNSCPDLVSE